MDLGPAFATLFAIGALVGMAVLGLIALIVWLCHHVTVGWV